MSNMIKNMILVIFSTFFSFYLLNGILMVIKHSQVKEIIKVARSKGIPFDERSLKTLLHDLNTEEMGVEPLVFPYLFIDNPVEIDGVQVLPLSGIAGAMSPHCNENGSYAIYDTDELGFNNPKGVHRDAGSDIALIGDSYTFGLCVEKTENIASNLRNYGYSVVSYGHGGNGPLLELATLTEYALKKHFKHYIWFAFPANDLSESVRDSKSEILMKYLTDEGYRQNLEKMVPQLNRKLRKFAAKELQRSSLTPKKIIFDLLLLRTLRGYFGLSFFPTPPDDDYRDGIQLFGEVLREAKKRIEKNGGQLTVVILPVMRNANIYGPMYEPARNEIIKSGVNFLDLKPVFNNAEDINSLLPIYSGHYSPKGYALVAETIHKYLQENK